MINNKNNKNNFKNLLVKTSKDKRGFTIEMAILVIVIMSGICMLLVTLMLIQNNKNKVADTIVDSQTTISQFGEDFYSVCKYVAWGASVNGGYVGVTKIYNLDKTEATIINPNKDAKSSAEATFDHLDNYKQYLEQYFYPEAAASELDAEDNIIWSSSPSSSVTSNSDYCYQPVGTESTVSYYYSYNIKNYTDAYELTISIHKATNEMGTYGVQEKGIVTEHGIDYQNYFNAIIYSEAQVVLSVRVEKEVVSVTSGAETTTTTYYKTTKWFYDSPTEANTQLAKDYLPYKISADNKTVTKIKINN